MVIIGTETRYLFLLAALSVGACARKTRLNKAFSTLFPPFFFFFFPKKKKRSPFFNFVSIYFIFFFVQCTFYYRSPPGVLRFMWKYECRSLCKKTHLGKAFPLLLYKRIYPCGHWLHFYFSRCEFLFLDTSFFIGCKIEALWHVFYIKAPYSSLLFGLQKVCFDFWLW